MNNRIVCPDCGAPIIVERRSKMSEKTVIHPDTGAFRFTDATRTTEDYVFECTRCRWFAYQHHLIFAVTDDDHVVRYEEGMFPTPDPQDS